MTAHLAIYGRLGGDPRKIETKTGKPMTVGSIAVDVGDSGSDSASEWFGVVAFGTLADQLLKHGKGDSLSVSGRLQKRTYTDGNGQQREQFQVLADSLISARTVRPSGRSKPSTTPTAESGSPNGMPFDDAIPF